MQHCVKPVRFPHETDKFVIKLRHEHLVVTYCLKSFYDVSSQRLAAFSIPMRALCFPEMQFEMQKHDPYSKDLSHTSFCHKYFFNPHCNRRQIPLFFMHWMQTSSENPLINLHGIRCTLSSMDRRTPTSNSVGDNLHFSASALLLQIIALICPVRGN